MTRGLSRQAGIPPTLCSAHTRRGTPCRRYCAVGKTVCTQHGGAAPQVIRKANERATLAQLLQGDPRPLAEVLLDATHTADAVFRELRLQVAAGDTVTVDQLDRMLERARLAHHLARTTVETGVVVKLVEQQRASVAEVGTFISEVLLSVLFELPLTPEWREYLLNVAEYRLLDLAHTRGTTVMNLPDGPPPERPVPPREPILVTAGPGA
jgi:uncharacterized membrane protein